MRIPCSALLIFALACGDDAEGPPVVVVQPGPTPGEPVPAPAVVAPEPVAEPTPTPTPTTHFNVGACTAGEAHDLGPLEARRGGIAVAFDSVRGGLLVRTRDADHVDVRRLSADGEPGEPTVVEMVGARDLRGVHRVGERFVVVTHAVCPETRVTNKCLNLRTLSPDGEAVGEVTTEMTREWMGPAFFEVEGDALVVLRSHTYIRPVLERYAVAEDGGIARSEIEGVVHESDEGIGANAWGLAVDGDRWAVLLRDEGGDEARFFLYLAGASEPVVIPLPILRRSTAGELAFDGDGLRLTIILEGGVRLARLRLDGTVAEPPREIAADEELSDNRIVPVLSTTRGRTTFARLDSVRRAVGAELELDVTGTAAVHGDGSGFVVAAAGTRDESGTAMLVTCAAR